MCSLGYVVKAQFETAVMLAEVVPAATELALALALPPVAMQAAMLIVTLKSKTSALRSTTESNNVVTGWPKFCPTGRVTQAMHATMV